MAGSDIFETIALKNMIQKTRTTFEVSCLATGLRYTYFITLLPLFQIEANVEMHYMNENFA